MLRHEDIIDPFQSELIEIDGVPTCVPILGVQFGETALKLHYWNSLVNVYANDNFNHVEYDGGEGKKGIQFSGDMIGLFRQMQYPTFFRPIVDPATEEWYYSIKRAELDIDLEGLN